MLASFPSQHVESDTTRFGNPSIQPEVIPL
jgi:hypothetical protein